MFCQLEARNLACAHAGTDHRVDQDDKESLTALTAPNIIRLSPCCVKDIGNEAHKREEARALDLHKSAYQTVAKYDPATKTLTWKELSARRAIRPMTAKGGKV